ncbi:helix-turn-helix domain-containing protein [Aeromicrobium chenweiae]|uniref:Transcriptional regulator n=1 Tax=Aeromicrobium chenweiae TaxID=2079793 RepID=A0A2S0WKU5_9ACTN|nr:helix-turn-helix transcriptional regulator [Aeromicrobium chenweiae]AWB91902.1 transcriptional regulator [Aeromicrobium chenweiae]TGN32751.1 transcriptional regulator [Aeromicrobium chenweiae]
MTNRPNTLGEYLRARRGLVTPQQAGIPDHGTRRVPGLRREEVAMLAGISADYYLRLERGRDHNPSLQVLESIARVLQLDSEHLEYLMTLTAEKPRHIRRRTPKEIVPPGMLKLLGSMEQPAFIEGRYFDILASNAAAVALSPRLVPGGNQLRDMFLDPAEQALYPDWKLVTNCFIASLRQAVGTDIDDPRFIELAGELTLGSAQFRELWARHDVKAQNGTPMRFDHPQVGEMTLNRERLTINGTDGLQLVVHHPDAGSEDAQKLALLVSAALPASEPERSLRPSS